MRFPPFLVWRSGRQAATMAKACELIRGTSQVATENGVLPVAEED